MNNMDADVLVIGGSIASSCLVKLLAERNLKIVVVDKKAFPRKKACGEGLSALALDLLKESGNTALLQHAKFSALSGYRFNLANNELCLGDSSAPRIYGVDREQLDNAAAEEAGKHCTRIVSKISDLVFDQDKWTARSENLSIQARFLVLADGNLSASARAIGINRLAKSPGRYGLSSWWLADKGHGIKEVEISELDSAHLYITPVSDTLLNLTVLGSQSAIKALSRNRLAFANILNSKGISTTECADALGSGPFDTKSAHFSARNCILIGDAAESFDPATGLGMYHAMFSATIGASAIKAFFAQKQTALQKYSKQLNDHNMILRLYSKAICLLMSKTSHSEIISFLQKFKIISIVDLMLHKLLKLNMYWSYCKAIKLSDLKITPVLYGLFTLLLFVSAVASMNYRLFVGLEHPFFDLKLTHPLIFDLLLVLQFPILHSLMLGKGRKYLSLGLNNDLLKKLSVTSYVLFASLQLLLVFCCWQFSGIEYIALSGSAFWIFTTLFALSNLYLAKAMYDAGLGVQIGTAGWIAAATDSKVKYPPMPSEGTFKYCRQPIYLSFFLLLWLSPILTADKLLLASIWSIYCVTGPVLKERRFKKAFGQQFEDYKQRTPYFIPKLN